jgi:hypothetical protein
MADFQIKPATAKSLRKTWIVIVSCHLFVTGVREGKTFPASEKLPSMLLVEPSGVGQLYIK